MHEMSIISTVFCVGVLMGSLKLASALTCYDCVDCNVATRSKECNFGENVCVYGLLELPNGTKTVIRKCYGIHPSKCFTSTIRETIVVCSCSTDLCNDKEFPFSEDESLHDIESYLDSHQRGLYKTSSLCLISALIILHFFMNSSFVN